MLEATTWRAIKLSAKVFGHISQGLYKTPAGAIKELVSNSFDAEATIIKIHTGFPHFETFSCEDNGSGLSLDEFERLMESGIGTSYKRLPTNPTTPTYHRPIIGRLGIGVLSLAQICTQFDIISHHRDSKKSFKATIKFPPYTKQEIDKIHPKNKDEVDNEQVKGGEYKLEIIEYDCKNVGVKIFTKYLRESFRKRMRKLSNYGNKIYFNKTDPYLSFKDFIESIYGTKAKTKSLNLLSDYDQLIFGLALAAPLPYFDNGQGNIALELPSLKEYQKISNGYNFRVEVDNLNMKRPIYLPSAREGITAKSCSLGKPKIKTFTSIDGSYKEKVDIEQYPVFVKGSDEQLSLYDILYSNQNVAGRPLIFKGYLFQQTGRLYPRDIQGILVRVRNVAIGKYDASIMVYPYAEGPRYSMVSMELFIIAGFEDALNIDRDSFNELHSHYIRTQSFVHSLLHDVIFPEAWTEEKTRHKERRKQEAIHRESKFIKVVSETTKETFTNIKYIKKPSIQEKAFFDKQSPVSFDIIKEAIEIDKTHPLVQNIFKRRRYSQLAEQIIIAFERANKESNESKRREIFYRLLADIIAEM